MQRSYLEAVEAVGRVSVKLLTFALLARIIYRKNSKGLLVYRILMGVHYLFQLKGIILVFCMVLCGFEVSIVLAIIYLLILIFSVIAFLYSVSNTYTERIFDIT